MMLPIAGSTEERHAQTLRDVGLPTTAIEKAGVEEPACASTCSDDLSSPTPHGAFLSVGNAKVQKISDDFLTMKHEARAMNH